MTTVDHSHPVPFRLGFQVGAGMVEETGVIMHEEIIVRENYLEGREKEMQANQEYKVSGGLASCFGSHATGDLSVSHIHTAHVYLHHYYREKRRL